VPVIQITGAQNISNRFYSVHPRRNDRFLKASRLMQTIFAEVDFTEFHFTRHLLRGLEGYLAGKVRDGPAGTARGLGRPDAGPAQRLNNRAVLVWMSRHALDDGPTGLTPADEPLFVTRGMVDALRPHVRDVVEIVARPEEVRAGRAHLASDRTDRTAAEDLLGAEVHARVAEASRPISGAGPPERKRPAPGRRGPQCRQA
jgi:hypothetical protein